MRRPPSTPKTIATVLDERLHIIRAITRGLDGRVARATTVELRSHSGVTRSEHEDTVAAGLRATTILREHLVTGLVGDVLCVAIELRAPSGALERRVCYQVELAETDEGRTWHPTR